MSDLTKILAKNQKEMLKLIAPLNKKQTVRTDVRDSDSEPENVSITRTSTPVKVHTATSSKTTPVNSRNKYNQLDFVTQLDLRRSRFCHQIEGKVKQLKFEKNGAHRKIFYISNLSLNVTIFYEKVCPLKNCGTTCNKEKDDFRKR